MNFLRSSLEIVVRIRGSQSWEELLDRDILFLVKIYSDFTNLTLIK
jgi:hypothetical protein